MQTNSSKWGTNARNLKCYEFSTSILSLSTYSSSDATSSSAKTVLYWCWCLKNLVLLSFHKQLTKHEIFDTFFGCPTFNNQLLTFLHRFGYLITIQQLLSRIVRLHTFHKFFHNFNHSTLCLLYLTSCCCCSATSPLSGISAHRTPILTIIFIIIFYPIIFFTRNRRGWAIHSYVIEHLLKLIQTFWGSLSY